MSINQLIPINEFQTAEPSNEGLLSVRSTNTLSPSNNNLIDTYGLIPIEMIPPGVVHENLPPNSPLITPATTAQELPVIFYNQGTCFTNLDSSVLITDKEELFHYLCDVLIRFDAAPSYYQKEDYEALIRVLTGSLIYLYDQDSTYNKSLSASPFLGLAMPSTNPILFAATNNYRFPGVYFAQIAGTYTNFGLVITPEDLAISVVMLIPNIINGIFVDYRKEIYAINMSAFTGDKTYRHSQSVSSNAWVITHNLGKYPSVTVQDSAGSVVEGEVQYINLNNLNINFSAPFGGYADLN